MRILIVMALLASVLVVGIVATPTDSTFQPLPADRDVPREAEPGVVSVGTVVRLPSKHIDEFQAFADSLARRITGWEEARGTVRFAPTMEGMAAMLADGDLDLYVDSPYPVLEVARRVGSVPFVRRWKRGTADYHGVVFVRADSGIDALDDLAGRRIAFEESSSTSGYALPRALLERDGLELVAADDAEEAPHAVRYLFSKADENTAQWVVDGRVDAGAVDDQTFAELEHLHPGELRALARSPQVPRQLVSHRAGLSPRFVASLREALLSMHLDEAGDAVLTDFAGTTRFDDFDLAEVPGIVEVFGSVLDGGR